MAAHLYAKTMLTYAPPQAISKKFRQSQVESLLNQSAGLIERCIDHLREVRGLDLAFNDLSIALEAADLDTALDEKRRDDKVFERNTTSALREKKFLDDSQAHLDASLMEATKLYGYAENEGQGKAGYTRAGQNLDEKDIEVDRRSADTENIANSIKWSQDDTKYLSDDVANRRTIVEKRKSLLVKDQAYSLDWQRDLVAARLTKDWADLCDRVSVVKRGLQDVYGYAEPAPVMPSGAATLDEAINDLYVWVRSALEWLIAYGQRDQAFTKVVSLKDLLNGTAWAHSADSFESTYSLASSMFPQHDNVRLRGIGGSMVGAGLVPWTVIVSVPTKAVFERNGARALVTQAMPSCVLGRVEDRRSYRPIEMCGIVSLTNASPISQTAADGAGAAELAWSVKILRPAGTLETFAQVQDFVFELDVVGVPRG